MNGSIPDSLKVTFVFESREYIASALIEQPISEYKIHRLHSDLKNLYNYLVSISDKADRFNELPIPKKGAGVAPEWTDAEREIFLKMEMESFKQVIDHLWQSLEKSRAYTKPNWENMISDIVKDIRKLDIKFKNDRAYFDDVRPVKNKMAANEKNSFFWIVRFLNTTLSRE